MIHERVATYRAVAHAEDNVRPSDYHRIFAGTFDIQELTHSHRFGRCHDEEFRYVVLERKEVL